ncbi:MAG TPA: gamma-glutamylcyclotransferase family protein [Pyrinomonadaceae bacterium]|nr:gamma-glutamylcyclotransferase family protein [Pyrinomonadaceae bacterium]
MDKHLVFVYGTLRREASRPMLLQFPGSRFVTDATVSGSLYDLGPYPGLVVNESNSLVKGEVYEVDEELLNELDQFEASSDYLRKRVEILIGSEKKEGWTYEPSSESYSLNRLIPSGDWIAYTRSVQNRKR